MAPAKAWRPRQGGWRLPPLPIVATALAVGISATPYRASAKTSYESPYTFEQTYGSTLRLVKVDLGLKVTDHDPAWGYLLFEYTSRQSGRRKSRGSFQFVRTPSKVRVSLELAAMPSHHERVIIDKLRRKLTEEHGTPPAPKPKKRKKQQRKGDENTDEASAPKKRANDKAGERKG